MAQKPRQTLTPRQRRAVAALLDHDTVREACQACGVPERTMRTWRTLPAFREACEEGRRDLWRHVVGRLASLSTTATAALARALDCGEKGADPKAAAVETRAALGVLAQAQAAEVADVAAGLEELRKVVEDLARGRGTTGGADEQVEGAGGEPPGHGADAAAGPAA